MSLYWFLNKNNRIIAKWKLNYCKLGFSLQLQERALNVPRYNEFDLTTSFRESIKR
jgi:hypothetical protein